MALGTSALGNAIGVELGAGRVGADGRDVDPTAERNIISGNSSWGVWVVGSHCVVAGNYVGTDVTGEVALSNGNISTALSVGIFLQADDNIIGTNDDGIGDDSERNVISGEVGLNPEFADGIQMFFGSTGNVIAGNYIGTDKTGTVPVGNGGGINLGNGHDNRVGVDGHDPYPAHERNIISGNGYGIDLFEGSNDVIAGNYIGTDVTGTISVGNGNGIIAVGPNSNELIGTNSDGVGDPYERNIISGNTRSGILFYQGAKADDDIVAGNYIGTDVTGTAALGNGWYGVAFFGGGNGNLVGVSSQTADPADGRNIVADNGLGGVFLTSLDSDLLSQTVVAGNYIGTDVSGELALGNGFGGVTVENATSTRIGTDGNGVADDVERNVISDNGRYGVGILSGAMGTPYGLGILTGTIDTVVAGNYIGTDAGGSAPLGNGGPGVLIWDASSTQVGGFGDLGNTIAYNRDTQITFRYYPGDGVAVIDNGSIGETIRGNSIFSNDGLGINFGYPFGDSYAEFGVIPNNSYAGQPGPNNFQNFPVLTNAYAGTSSTVIGTFNSKPNTTFSLDFYANAAPDPSGYGQGQRYLGAYVVATDANGDANFTATGLLETSPGEWISATATDPGGDTSEFSQVVQAINVLTTTALTSSANTSSFGQALAFRATVTANSGSGTPTGFVDFFDVTTDDDLGSVALSGGVGHAEHGLAAGRQPDHHRFL